MELALACWRLLPTFQLPPFSAFRSKIAAFGCPPSIVEKNAWDCRLSGPGSLRPRSKKWFGACPPDLVPGKQDSHKLANSQPARFLDTLQTRMLILFLRCDC